LLAKNLLGLVAKELLGCGIEIGDPPVRVGDNERVFIMFKINLYR